jgi:hypothetical protein
MLPRARAPMPKVHLARLGVKSVGMGSDIAEEVQGIGCEAGLVLRGCQRAFSQLLRLV